MGRSVLACQFVAGLLLHLKSKLTGHDGGFEELLTKARYEEVQYRDVVVPSSKHSTTSSSTVVTSRSRAASQAMAKDGSVQRLSSTTFKASEIRRCYHCGGTNHLLGNVH